MEDNRNNVFYSPEGNPEVWDKKPEGYFTEEEWKAAHPDPAPEPPSPEELKAQRITEIISRLGEIDKASIRPLRTIAKGTEDGVAADKIVDDRLKLAELEDEAVLLRTEYKEIGGE